MASTAWAADHFVGGDVALDLANTVWRRTPEVGTDLLDSPTTLVSWFEHAGLLQAGDESSRVLAHPAQTLKRAKALRGALWHALDPTPDRTVPTAAVRQVLQVAGAEVDGDVVLAVDGTATARSAGAALAVVALHALRLVVSPPLQPIRACDSCGWFFLDTSRSRQRRWCSMKTCGNQAKAARHRARTR